MVSGDFLDFLVAIVCLILVLRAHKLIRHFLDMLIPGGPSPGGLGHAMMEGLGFAVGTKLGKGAVNGAVAAGTVGAGMGISAVHGGMLASSASRNDLLPPLAKIGTPAGPEVNKTPQAGTSEATKGSTPPFPSSASPMSPMSPTHSSQQADNDLFGIQAQVSTAIQNPFENAQIDDSNPGTMESDNVVVMPLTAQAATDQFLNLVGQGGKRMIGKLYDNQHKVGNVYTSITPSAAAKLGVKTEPPKSAAGRFVQGMGVSLSSDLNAKLSGRKYAHGKTLWQNLQGQREQFNKVQSEKQNQRNQLLPSEEMLADYNSGDIYAQQHMWQIGQAQQSYDEGYGMMLEADAIEEKIAPDYNEAQAEYDRASFTLSTVNTLFLEAQVRGMEKSDPANFRVLKEQRAMAKKAVVDAETGLAPRREQMKIVTNLRDRAIQKMKDAERNISTVNTRYLNERRGNNIERAIANAGPRRFGDL